MFLLEAVLFLEDMRGSYRTNGSLDNPADRNTYFILFYTHVLESIQRYDSTINRYSLVHYSPCNATNKYVSDTRGRRQANSNPLDIISLWAVDT